jgi:prepilin-type N-terminal cleavage/methylation domain-containing protein
MFIRDRAKANGGFTLLEVMVATVILAMITFALYRFISTTLRAIDVTTQITEDRHAVEALTKMVQAELNDLPPRGPGVLLGKANKFHDLSCDELTWLCRAGPGVMTGAAPGEYRVTLTVQPAQDKSSELELGLRRELATADSKSDVDFFTRGGGSSKYNWLPLIRPVAALEIRYWDARLNSPLQQWSDPNTRPSFVHMKIWKTADDLPYDVILPVPASFVQTQ